METCIMREYKEWQYVAKVVVGRSIAPEIYLSFFRQVPGRDWYDEVRYDSHEVKRRKRLKLPHYHIKLRGDYREREEAEESLKQIIDDVVPQILEVTENGEKAD
jgi:hypothetical protein